VTDAAGITDVAASGAGRLDDNSRIFDATARLTLDGLTLTGGRTTAEGADGGAVRSTGAALSPDPVHHLWLRSVEGVGRLLTQP
jgi:hypothetical protein